MTGKRYRIGVDVGDKSVGLAAIEEDGSGTPTRVLAALSYIHDGGFAPGTAKSPQSRKATAGTARRTRRLFRRRRQRLRDLDQLLIELGWPVPAHEEPQTYEAWAARDLLSEAMVADETARLSLLTMAVRHMARHRGWRNPWLSVEQLANLPVPTENFTAMQQAAAARLGIDPDSLRTVGQLARGALRPSTPIRPRTADKALARDMQPVLSHRVLQEDQLADLRLILELQGINEQSATRICKAVFTQKKPHVPVSRIGHDSLPGMSEHPRASRATLEFQQFRVRAVVANLRISDGRQRHLSPDEQDRLVEFLLNWRSPEPPNWLDVADELGIRARQLRGKPGVDEFGSTGVPTDRTSTAIEDRFGKSTSVGRWWREASWIARTELVDFVSDPTDSAQQSEELAQVLEALDDTELGKLDTLSLESGRCPYSRASLSRLTDRMQTDHLDLHEARKLEFGADDNWQPPKETFDTPIDHPTVAIISKTVHRFLLYCTEQWGLPRNVVVEHVRGAFLGPTGRAQYIREIDGNRRRREDAKKAIEADEGVQHPTNSDVRRRECLQRQNCQCLYCGSPITWTTSELDHIVPRKGGGSNRSDNLVAVCRECNSQKSNLPFVLFARHSRRPGVSVEDAAARIKEWNRAGMTGLQFSQLKRRVVQRLKLEDDEDVEDRSIESTAYAARQMRERIGQFLADRALAECRQPPPVSVFPGAVTASARRAGGVDAMLRLRGKGTKDRFDRRHHAIDAAVQSTITPFVAEVLAERSRLRASHLFTGDQPGWKEFEGNDVAHQIQYRKWRERIRVLVDLLAERVAADRIAVVRPLRLSASIGEIHQASVLRLVDKDVRSEWTPSEVDRIVNPEQFESMAALVGSRSLLAADSRRLSVNGEPMIQLFKETAAQILMRGGSCKIGDTIHHSRIYAWPVKSGYRYGQIRVFAGEFARLGMLAPGVDLLTHPLTASSESMRTADATVRAKVLSGEARMIGWIAVNDEIEIDPHAFLSTKSQLARALEEIPERRWVVTGFYGSRDLSISPSLLASEGLAEVPATEFDPIPNMRKILEGNRTTIAPNVILGAPGTKVIRRSISGLPRWRHDGLPYSWDVRQATERAFST